jgi:hypothetical protein
MFRSSDRNVGTEDGAGAASECFGSSLKMAMRQPPPRLRALLVHTYLIRTVGIAATLVTLMSF